MTKSIEHLIREFRSAKLAATLAVVTAVLIIDVVWLWNSPFQFRENSLQWPVLTAIGAIFLLPFVKMQSLRTVLTGYILLTVAWPVLRLFNHLTFTISGDYVDAMLAHWDAAVHLPWIAYAAWLDHHPSLTLFISLAYGSLTPLSIVVFVLAAFFCSKDAAEEYLLLFVILAVIVSIIGIFLPAFGPMVYFEDVTSKFKYLAPVGHAHVAFYNGYKASTIHVMQLEGLMGLTTFPSFHTAMGCLMVYVSRQRLIFLVPTSLYSAMMIAGAVVFGSHYFVDLFGGFAITVLAILLIRAVEWYSRNSQLLQRHAQVDISAAGIS